MGNANSKYDRTVYYGGDAQDMETLQRQENENLDRDLYYEERANKTPRPLRKLIRSVQVLMNELHDMDEDDEDYGEVLEEIESALYQLQKEDYPLEKLVDILDIDEFELAKENFRARNKRVTFQKPKIAFYEVDNISANTPLQKHASLGELSRHRQEMTDAYEEASKDPVWFGGSWI